MDCLTFPGSQQKNQGLLQAVSTPDSSGSRVRPCSKAQKVLECRLEASGLSLSFCAGATTRRVPCTGQPLPGPHVVSGQQQVSALREKLSWKRLWPGPSPSIRPLSRTEGGFGSRERKRQSFKAQSVDQLPDNRVARRREGEGMPREQTSVVIGHFCWNPPLSPASTLD